MQVGTGLTIGMHGLLNRFLSAQPELCQAGATGCTDGSRASASCIYQPVFAFWVKPESEPSHPVWQEFLSGLNHSEYAW
jgi:hypothetical protein